MNPSAWKSSTWDGNRAAQHQEFRSLSFREKLLEIERMGEVAELFEARRLELGLPVRVTEEDPPAPRLGGRGQRGAQR